MSFDFSLMNKQNGRTKDVFLTLSWRRSLSYKNKFIDLQSKFLYDRDIRHERVKNTDELPVLLNSTSMILHNINKAVYFMILTMAQLILEFIHVH